MRIYHDRFSTCRVHLASEAGRNWEAVLTDVSMRGLGVGFAELGQLPSVGDQLEVRVVKASGEPVIEGKGHLAWLDGHRPAGGIELVPGSVVTEAFIAGAAVS